MRKRILAGFLSVVMLLGMLPASAFAVETEDEGGISTYASSGNKKEDVEKTEEEKNRSYTAKVEFVSGDTDGMHFESQAAITSTQKWYDDGKAVNNGWSSIAIWKWKSDWKNTNTSETQTVTIAPVDGYKIISIEVTPSASGLGYGMFDSCVSYTENSDGYTVTVKAPDAEPSSTGFSTSKWNANDATVTFTVTVTTEKIPDEKYTVTKGTIDEGVTKVTVGSTELTDEGVEVAANQNFIVSIDLAKSKQQYVKSVTLDAAAGSKNDDGIWTVCAGAKDGRGELSVELGTYIQFSDNVVNGEYFIDYRQDKLSETVNAITSDSLKQALLGEVHSALNKDDITAQIKTTVATVDGLWDVNDTSKAATFTLTKHGTVVLGLKKEAGRLGNITNTYESADVNVHLRPYTTFTVNEFANGSVELTAKGDAEMTKDGTADVWKSYVVDGEKKSTFTVTPVNGYYVKSLTATAAGDTDGSSTVTASGVASAPAALSVDLPHDKVWTITAVIEEVPAQIFSVTLDDSTTSVVKVGDDIWTAGTTKTFTPEQSFTISVEASDKNTKVIDTVTYGGTENAALKGEESGTLTFTAGEDQQRATLSVTEKDKKIVLKAGASYKKDYRLDKRSEVVSAITGDKLYETFVDETNSVLGSDKSKVVAQYQDSVLNSWWAWNVENALPSGTDTRTIRFAVANDDILESLAGKPYHYYSSNATVTLNPYTEFLTGTYTNSDKGTLTAADADDTLSVITGGWKSTNVSADTKSTFTARATDSEYECTGLTAVDQDGSDSGVNAVRNDDGSYSITLSHDKVWTITPKIEKKAARRNVTLYVGVGGSVKYGEHTYTGNSENTPSCFSVLLSQDVALTFTPAEGYVLDQVSVGAAPVDVTGTTYTISGATGETSVETTVIVQFKEKTLAMTDKTTKDYEYPFRGSAADVIGGNFEKELIEYFVDLENSVPALSVSDVTVEYKAGLITWKELGFQPTDGDITLHAFGANAAETIRFKGNGKTSEERTVTFTEAEGLTSILTVAQPLTMTYTKDAAKIVDLLYNNLTLTNEDGVAITGTQKGDFTYYYYCDLLDVLSTASGVSITIPDELLSMLTGMGLNLTKVPVDAAQVSDVEDLLKATLGASLANTFIETLKISDEVLAQPVTPNVGEVDVKVTWDGDDTYKGSEWTGKVTITKAPCTLDVTSKTITYGESVPSMVTTDPAGVNKVVIYAGVNGDVNDPAFVSVILPNGALYEALEKKFPDGFALKDLEDVLTAIGQAVNTDILDKIMDAVPDQVKNFTVKLGQTPENAGAYVVAAITVDGNYETAYDVGLLTIKPQIAQMKAVFNAAVPTTVLQKDLNGYDFGGYIAYTESGTKVDADECPALKCLIVGVDSEGNTVKITDPAKAKELKPGVYTQTLYTESLNQIVTPAVRTITVLSRQFASISVESKNLTYGQTIPTIASLVTTDPAGLGHLDLCVGLTTGIDGVIYMDGKDGSGSYWTKLKTHYPTGFKLSQLEEILTKADVPEVGQAVTAILNKLPEDVKANAENITVTYGQPTDAGVYTVIAVLADGEYYPSLAAGVLTVKPVTGMKIQFNAELAISVRQDELKDFDFGGKVVDEEGTAQTGCTISCLLTGLTTSGETVYLTDPAQSDLENLKPGAYTQTLYVKDSNNLIVPAVRAFTVRSRDLASIDVTSATITYGDIIPTMVSTTPAGAGYIALYAGVTTAADGELFMQGQGIYWNKLIKEGNYPNGFTLSQLPEILEKAKLPNAAEAAENLLAKLPESVQQAAGRITVKKGLPSEAGVYVVAAALVDDSYYPMADAGLLTIKMAETGYTVTFDKNEFTYNTQPQAPVPTVKDADGNTVEKDLICTYWKKTQVTIQGETKDLYVILNEKPSDVGEYGIAVVGWDFNNLPVGKQYAFEIKPAQVTFQIDDKTKRVGEADPAFTYQVLDAEGKNVTALETFDCTFTRAAGETAGEYAITLKEAAPDFGANYTVEFVPGTLTIEKRSSSGGGSSPSDLNTQDHMAYVGGFADGTVRPNDTVTRAQVATMLTRLLTDARRAQIQTTVNNFTDVTADLWYNEAASIMAKGGYIAGYADGTFGGDRGITRAEFVTILVQFIGLEQGKCSFTDVDSSFWAYGYIATAVKSGWVSGYEDGSFRPDQTITRAEAMTVINRVLGRGVSKDSKLLDFIQWPDNDPAAWYYYEVIEATNDHKYTGSAPKENWTSLTVD